MFREIISNEFYTILIVISLVLIACAKALFPKRFNDFIYVIGNFKYLKIYARDQKFFDKFDALLFVNLILTSAVFIFLVYNTLIESIEPSIDFMFKLAFGIGVFILIKVLLERLIGSLFEIDQLVDKYVFQKISYKNFLGLVLLPINAILIFSITPSNKIVYVLIALVIAINVIGLIVSFKSHQNLIKNNLFYFILYLCALEIAPYIILYRVFDMT